MTHALLAVSVAAGVGCQLATALPAESWPTVVVDHPPVSNLTDGCVASFDPGLDYFPDKVTVDHADSFRVQYHGHYKTVDFEPRIGSAEVVRYVLVQCGTPAPVITPGVRVITVPVRRFVSVKLEFFDVIDQLGIVDQLVGVSGIRPITVPSILDRHRRGLVAEVGTGTHSTIELAIGVQPDIVFTFYSAFAEANMHAQLWDAGVVGIPLADHFESMPLGRSEWLKFMALFFNHEARATTVFNTLEQRYRELAALTAEVSHRPDVLLGGPESRTHWALNGGRNFLARVIDDAGGRYVWTTPSARSLDMAAMEQVFALSHDASFWIGNMYGATARETLIDREPRLRTFGPVMAEGVYSSDRGRTATGGYPLANEAVGRMDVLLADYIRILHPDLLPGHELVYHHRLQ